MDEKDLDQSIRKEEDLDVSKYKKVRTYQYDKDGSLTLAKESLYEEGNLMKQIVWEY